MLHDILRRKRKEKNLNQAQMAKLLGVHQSTYSNWECGKYEPDNQSLKRIADIFETSIDFLLGRY